MAGRWSALTISMALVAGACGAGPGAQSSAPIVPRELSTPTPRNTPTPRPPTPTPTAIPTPTPLPEWNGLRIAVVGDWYEDDPLDDAFIEDAYATRDAMVRARPDVTIGLGDFMYSTTRLEPFAAFVAPLASISPILPTFGNHDGFKEDRVEQPSYYRELVEFFGFDEFFSLDWGPVRFISIHSEYIESSPRYDEQIATITGALQEAFDDPDISVIIPFSHNAMANPLSNRGPNRILQEVYHPILQAYAAKIPVVLQADHHTYTRTHVIRQLGERTTNCRPDDGIAEICESQYEVIDQGSGTAPTVYENPGEGIMFVTVGTGGAHPTGRTPSADFLAARHVPVSATKDPAGGSFGYLMLTIDPDATTMIGEFHTNDGNILDSFEIVLG